MDEGPTLGFENVFHQLKGFSNQNITFETLPMFCFCIMIISTIIIMIKMYFFITKALDAQSWNWVLWQRRSTPEVSRGPQVFALRWWSRQWWSSSDDGHANDDDHQMMIMMTITTMMLMMGTLLLNEHFPRRAGGGSGSKTRWQAPLVDIRVGAAAGS